MCGLDAWIQRHALLGCTKNCSLVCALAAFSPSLRGPMARFSFQPVLASVPLAAISKSYLQTEIADHLLIIKDTSAENPSERSTKKPSIKLVLRGQVAASAVWLRQPRPSRRRGDFTISLCRSWLPCTDKGTKRKENLRQSLMRNCRSLASRRFVLGVPCSTLSRRLCSPNH